jgi:prepilin-type N-terminal cleavage/methylation domain-containing protein
MPIRNPRHRREHGFTLAEMIIVVAILGIIILIGLPSFLGTLNRTRLTAASRQIASLLQLARIEAIKYNVPAKVTYDPTSRRFSGFLDLDRDGVFDATERPLSASVDLPRKILFQGPGDAAENGAAAIDLWDDDAAIMGPSFQNDGSANLPGAFRIADTHENILEVRIQSTATGKVVLRKWDRVATKFYTHLENGQAWEWY